MASVFERPDREFLYAKIRDPQTLAWRGVKTPFRKDAPAARRNALMWANARDAVGAENVRLARSEIWAAWVVPWLQQHFGYNERTLARYLTAWAHVFVFLGEREIRLPREVLYRHASEYLLWRTTQKRHRGTTINHNTALTEMKIMSRVLEEARRREFIQANPWARLGIRRKNVRHAPAISSDEIIRWRAALDAEESKLPIAAQWMTTCFELALHQGLRLSATAIPMDRVHLDPRTNPKKKINLDRITIFTKGRNGNPKVQALPLHPALRPRLLALRAAKAAAVCVLPPMAAKILWKFRQRHALGHLRFHSTRATLATELARRNVPMQKAKEILGHSSEAVHLAYLHLSAADVADELGATDFSTPTAPETPDAPPPKP